MSVSSFSWIWIEDTFSSKSHRQSQHYSAFKNELSYYSMSDLVPDNVDKVGQRRTWLRTMLDKVGQCRTPLWGGGGGLCNDEFVEMDQKIRTLMTGEIMKIFLVIGKDCDKDSVNRLPPR